MSFLKKIKLPSKFFYFRRNNVTIEEMSAKLFWIPNELAKPLGCNIFSEDFNWKNNLFYLSMLVLFIFVTSHINALFIYKDDFKMFIFVVITACMIFQVFGKLHAFIIKRPAMWETVCMCRNFLTFVEDERMRNSFEKWLLIGFHGEALVALVFALLFVFVLILPGIIYLLFDVALTIAGCIIPFTDIKTPLGFTTNLCFQMIGAFLALLAFTTAIMDVVCFLVHFLAFYESLEILLDKLESLIDAEKTVEVEDEIKRILNKLVDGHNMCYEFLDTFESSFMFYHMFEIGGSMCATVLCLYAVTKVN